MSRISNSGRIELTGFSLPSSPLLSETSRELFVEQARRWETFNAVGPFASIEDERNYYASMLLPTLDKQRRRHNVAIEIGEIAGVRVERIFPRAGSKPNQLLLNLHGGGFRVGGGVSALIESIPIASTAGIEVVSVDYRMAPEYRHPAAIDDVAAVYKDLLARWRPEEIGVFGSSAGALLCGQVVSRLVGEGAPAPGALGLFALGCGRLEGDSFNIFSTIDDVSALSEESKSYMGLAAADDPTAYPALFPDRLAAFPPTLLLSSTRDLGLSSVVDTHARLIAAGVSAELHVWEGLRHCFYYDPDFSESAAAYAVAANFFHEQLN